MSRKLVWRRRTAEGFYRPAGQLPSVAALGFCRRARFLVRLSPPQPSEKWRRRGRDGVGVFEIGNFGISTGRSESLAAVKDAPRVENVEGKVKALLERIEDGKVREEIQSIFLQMGFEEMATNNFVESSFWNFDALFQPQQHPAHDSHDPASRRSLPEDYVERVKLVLESGGYGSKGYGYDWKGKKLVRISFGQKQLQFLLEYFTCLLSSVMHFCCCPSREMNHQPEEIEQDQSTKPSINCHTKPAPLCNSYHHQIQGVRCNQKPACCFQCHPNHRAQLFFSVNPARHPGTQSSGRRHCSLGPSSVANQASSEYQCLPPAHT